MSVYDSPSSYVVQPPYNWAKWAIVVDEDWIDPLPRIREGDDPLDLSGVVMEMFVRPTYNYATIIKKLSTATGEIVLDDAVNGLASISMSQANVEASMPIGEWDYFVRILSGGVYRELFRGPLFVYAGRTTA